jgi:DNA gyrase subunit A
MIITQAGNILRIPVSSLRVMGRATQGVRLINIKENDSIASVAYVEVNEEDNVEETDNQEPSEEAVE